MLICPIDLFDSSFATEHLYQRKHEEFDIITDVRNILAFSLLKNGLIL